MISRYVNTFSCKSFWTFVWIQIIGKQTSQQAFFNRTNILLNSGPVLILQFNPYIRSSIGPISTTQLISVSRYWSDITVPDGICIHTYNHTHRHCTNAIKCKNKFQAILKSADRCLHKKKSPDIFS